MDLEEGWKPVGEEICASEEGEGESCEDEFEVGDQVGEGEEDRVRGIDEGEGGVEGGVKSGGGVGGEERGRSRESVGFPGEVGEGVWRGGFGENAVG